MKNWKAWLERIVGASFILSGGIKLLSPLIHSVYGTIEDTTAVLQKMATANAGTEIGDFSNWMSANEAILVPIVGLVMFVSGLAQLSMHRFSIHAALVQSLMILGFVVFLHRAFPTIFLDGLYLLAFIMIYFEFSGRHTEKAAPQTH